MQREPGGSKGCWEESKDERDMGETVKQGVWDKDAYVPSLLTHEARYHCVVILQDTQVKSVCCVTVCPDMYKCVFVSKSLTFC